MAKGSVQAIAFDLDGTLVDSKIDFTELRRTLGLAPEDPILEVIDTWPESKRVWGHEIVHQFEVAGAEKSKIIEGVPETLSFLNHREIPFSIFTRNSRATAMQTLKMHGLTCDLVLTRNDAEPKPKPDGLHLIAKHFSITTSSLLFVGDYLYDLQAGLSAGAPTALFLPDPANVDFPTAGAVFCFQRYPELVSWLNL
jgi:HAD superfamily hydrolase (TIGR01509 family)